MFTKGKTEYKGKNGLQIGNLLQQAIYCNRQFIAIGNFVSNRRLVTFIKTKIIVNTIKCIIYTIYKHIKIVALILP